MKKFWIVPVAALAIGSACGDGLTTRTTEPRFTPGGVLNDDIVNRLDASVDAEAEVMPLNAGGSTATTKLYLVERNGDGKNGCNLTGSTTVVIAVSSSNTSVATVTPSSVTFTSCGQEKTLTVTSGNQGTSTISMSETSNSTDGSFELGTAQFTVNVTAPPPANNAPSVQVTGVTGGANYNKGSVPSATCSVTDAEDGSPSFAATLSAVTGPYSTDGIGEQTASCSYTDAGGLTATASKTYNIVDGSAPTIGYTLNPADPDGDGGWYKSNVTLTWDVADPESPNSLQKTGCVDQDIKADLAETTYSCSVTSAGGSAGPTNVTIKRDGTPPSVDYTSASGTAGDAGWYTSNVTATFTATDGFSGVKGSSTGTATTSGEGASVTIGSPAFSDNAGNTAIAGTKTSDPFKIDLTDPTNVDFTGGPAAGGSYYFGSVPATATCTADDAISGLASCVVTGYSTAVGIHTLTATATDHAGRTATATRSYSVLAWTLNGFYQPVDMNGVYNTVKAGSTVPLKFEVFAGSTEKTATTDIKSFTSTPITCSGTALTDDIEVTTTGGTSLRYDATGGQFVQNWLTPSKPSTCHKVTMTALDGTSITAYFKLK